MEFILQRNKIQLRFISLLRCSSEGLGCSGRKIIRSVPPGGGTFCLCLIRKITLSRKRTWKVLPAFTLGLPVRTKYILSDCESHRPHFSLINHRSSSGVQKDARNLRAMSLYPTSSRSSALQNSRSPWCSGACCRPCGHRGCRRIRRILEGRKCMQWYPHVSGWPSRPVRGSRS